MSTPPAQTRSGSSGSTAMTLTYQPIAKYASTKSNWQSTSEAITGLWSSRVLIFTGSVLRTRACQLPAAPPASERNTACRACSNRPPGPGTLLAARA